MLYCRECGREFETQKSLSGHIWNFHHITVKDYYDKYLKKFPNEGICICGNHTTFRGTKYGYSKHCSCKCSAIDEKTKRKREQTNLQIFGVDYPAKSEHVKEKISDVFMEKYGVPWGFQSETVKEKIENTFLREYGVRCLFQLPEVREKAMTAINENLDEVNRKKEATSLARYGETSWTKTDWGRKALSDMGKDSKMIEKKTISMKENNSFHFSKGEGLLYSKLVDIFGIDGVKREHFSDKYPYKCDFYIEPIDTYIEYNGFWHHGGHWFNEENPDDIKMLADWEQKAETSQNYKKAIYTWCVRDIEKRTCAINNNINYIVLWNTKEISSLSF